MRRAVRNFVMGGACFLLLAHPRLASAHLLDAYLQAAQISLSPEQVTVNLYLTPGVQIAPGVLATVDTDGDGTVSAAECKKYVESVLPRLALAVDGKPLTLQLTASDSASVEELRQGVGALHLKAVAQLPKMRTGVHRVRFENTFHPAGGLYLANAMLPQDARIVIREQQRDSLQHTDEISYELRATKQEMFLRTAGLILGAAALWALWWVAMRLRAGRAGKAISA